MSTDIVERLRLMLHARLTPAGENEVLTEAIAEIVRLRGEVAPAYDRELIARMLELPDDFTLESRLGCAVLLRASDNADAAGVRTASMAPAEAKGCSCPRGASTMFDLIDKACPQHGTPQPADGGAVEPFLHVCRFDSEHPWEITAGRVKACEKCVPLYTYPPAAQVQQDALKHWPQIKLWFFRELTSAQRISLLALCGLPTDEIGESHVGQHRALMHVLATHPAGDALGAVKIDDAMVERGLRAFNESRNYGGNVAGVAMRDALTAALRPSAGEGRGNG